MAFNFKTFAAVGALIGSLALVGCGQDEKDPNHIKVGVIVGAEQQEPLVRVVLHHLCDDDELSRSGRLDDAGAVALPKHI